MSNTKFVRVDIDPHAPLSTASQAEIAALLANPNREIDVSDVPPLNDDVFRNAAPSPFYRPPADGMTVRLDPDVAAWLRASGHGYPTKLNTILRQAMRRDLAPASDDK